MNAKLILGWVLMFAPMMAIMGLMIHIDLHAFILALLAFIIVVAMISYGSYLISSNK